MGDKTPWEKFINESSAAVRSMHPVTAPILA